MKLGAYMAVVLQGLFRKILGGRIRASKLVRMTADDLANRELAQWREHETKHVSSLYTM